MTARSFILFVIGFSGLLCMEGCGSTHTITLFCMSAPSVASDPQRLAALISGRAQPSGDRSYRSALKRTLSAKGGSPGSCPGTHPYRTYYRLQIKRFRIIVAESGPLKKLWKPPAVWKFIDFHFLLTGPICRTSLTSDPCPKRDPNLNPM